MRIIVRRQKAPGIAGNKPRSEQHSGAVTPECRLDCNSSTAPSERKRGTVDMRQLKALEIAARSKITYSDGVWRVPSQTSPGTFYRVTLSDPVSWQCEDFQLRQDACKHIIACRIVLARDGKGTAPVIVTDAVPRRPTYRQNWPAYNLAQMTEKHRLQALLFDLARQVPELPYKGVGRRRAPMADVVFACAFKVYSTVSSRRFACDLNDAHGRGYLSRPLHPNKINC